MAGVRNLQLGRYALGERIATGGMGEVYLARQESLGNFEKLVAMKLLLPHLAEDPDAVEGFLAEARLQARMSHPNVVQIFDVGEQEGYLWLAMELVRGVALSRLVKAVAAAGERLDARELAWIGRSLCEGLHHAHELTGPGGERLEVVHRDVTPHNVLISVNGEVKLADFGIAKASSRRSTTQAGVIKGKFEYMPPEQARGEAVDRRADIFGAGVTLYAAGALESPFRRATDAQTLAAIEREPLPPLAQLRPDLAGALSDAIARATETDVSKRMGTARELRDALPQADLLAAEALGARVQRLCAPAIEALDVKTEATRHRGGSTSAGTAELTGARAGRRLWPWGGAALALAAAGLAVTAAVRRAPSPVANAPAPQPAEVRAAPEPGVPVKPLPTPAAAAEAPAASRGAEVEPAPAASKPAAAHKKGPGRITVDAVPWATVFVDGREIGVTPIADYLVPSGSLTVELKNVKTRRTVTKRVTVAPGKATIVKADLR
ncbi:MAG: serine/threonine protein kinase [Archangiaceae bacterium]|nr:serine/threonine protein kinase [Archangiaceae bacterium]